MKIRREYDKVTAGMSVSKFFMLGVIHRDAEGPVLLKNWLDRIRPDVITLELSHYGIRFRREFGEEYKERIGRILMQRKERGEPFNKEALSSLLSYVSTPYEYEVASAYAVEHSAPLYLIDMDFFSYVRLRSIEDLLSEKNIEKVLSLTDASDSSQEMTTARLFFEKGIKIAQYDREMCIRDRYMSSKIQDFMKHSNGKRFLHVCGWQHLQDLSNFYFPLNPIKVFSHDKAFCL
jgi:hypothetical protein